MHDLTPRTIVAALDRHIIGQDRAKRAVAVAVRNRWRRRRLDPEIGRENAPKNIIMVGPTGVGKTEIARRLSALVGAPFIKVEASKYTEVGYHGRDVESMVRDLLELGVNMVRQEHAGEVCHQAEGRAETRLAGLLLGEPDTPASGPWPAADADADAETEATAGDGADTRRAVRDRMLEKVRDRALEDREIEITVRRDRRRRSSA